MFCKKERIFIYIDHRQPPVVSGLIERVDGGGVISIQANQPVSFGLQFANGMVQIIRMSSRHFHMRDIDLEHIEIPRIGQCKMAETDIVSGHPG